MAQDTSTSDFDDSDTDDDMTDTSVFDADEIVRSIESVASSRNSEVIDSGILARRRFEALQEEKRLKAELRDIDEYDFDD